MAVGAQQTDSGLKAESNHYMKETWRKGKRLKDASALRIGSNIMVVLQCEVKPMVGAKK